MKKLFLIGGTMGIGKLKSACDNIIFCWVMHKQAIIDKIISGLDVADCSVKSISLIADEANLINRLTKINSYI